MTGGFKNMNADQIIKCILGTMLKLEKTVDSNLNNKLDRGGYQGNAQDLSDSIESIYQPDTVIRYTAPTRVGNTFTFPSGGYDVLLSKQFHTNTSELETTIAAATDGFKRIDLVYFKSDNTIAKIQGTESATVAVRPEVPVGGIELCLINVFGATIEVSEVNGAYVQKSERANVVLTGSGVINQLDLVDEKATIVFKGSITRLNTISYASVPYNGKTIRLFNAQATPVTIGHSVSGYGVDFVFLDGQDYILLPNQTIEFSFDITYAPYAHHMLIGSKTDISGKEDIINKGIANGYVPLDEFSKIAHQFLSIVNNLTTGGTTSLLSAEQGVVLQTQINNINVLLASDNVNLDNVQELVDAIESLQVSLNTILVNDLTSGGITKALTAEMGKQLDLIKESTSNKSTSIAVDYLSNIKFPSVKAVYDFCMSAFKKKFLDFGDVFGIAHTFGEGSENTMYKFSNNNPITATIPTNATTPFEIGTVFETIAIGNGALTVTGAPGVTILTNLSNTSVKNEVRRYTKIDTDTWTVEGGKNDLSQFTDQNSVLAPKRFNTIFVHNTLGNDTTGQFENPNKPFATLQKALEFQSSIEGNFPRDINIHILNNATYQVGNKMLSGSADSATNIKLFNINIKGVNGVPTLNFTNGVDMTKTTLDNVNVVHNALANSPPSGGLVFKAGNTDSYINIKNLIFNNITSNGNVFNPSGTFQYFQIDNVTIANTCTNLQFMLSGLRSLFFQSISNIVNNANSFSGSTANSIMVPPYVDMSFGTITNNSTSAINLWLDYTGTPAKLTLGNIISENALMRIPLGIASGDYRLNTKLQLIFSNSTLKNCWISGNTVNSQCSVTGKINLTFTLQSPFITVSRNRLNTDFSNFNTFIINNLELNVNYSGITPSNPIISIPNPIYSYGVGLASSESQVILENVKIKTNVAIDIFRIPSGSKLDTPRLIIFRGVNTFDNQKELINCGVIPTEPKYITSQKAVIYHVFNTLSNQPLNIYQEQSY